MSAGQRAMTNEQLLQRVGQKVKCDSPRCIGRSWHTVFGVLDQNLMLATTCSIRNEPGRIVALGRPKKDRRDGAAIIPLDVRLRCWVCRRVMNLRDLGPQHFA